MPLHDWTRVTPNDFHDMHVNWIAAIRTRLNTGLLPDGYYAMAEHASPPFVPDVLTLGTRDRDPSPAGGGGAATATAVVSEVTLTSRRRRPVRRPSRLIVVRHVEEREIVAVIELVSPGNKAKASAVRNFVEKSAAVLDNGIHLAIVDVFPNPPRLAQGFGGAVWRSVERTPAEYAPRFSRTHSSFLAKDVRGCVAHFQSSEVGADLPTLPLYLTEEWHVMLPLEETYQAAWVGYPKPLRRILEAPPATLGEPEA